jgi:GxxExxY protein
MKFQILSEALFSRFTVLWGPGLLESVYVAALVFELRKAGLIVKTEVPLPAVYEGEKLELGFSPPKADW